MVVAMRRWKVFPLVLIAPVVLGCSGGKFDYVRPTSDPRVENTKLVPKPRDVVWNIPSCARKAVRFFVSNNLDKSTGLVNLSYSGVPEKYLDCG